MHWAWEQEALGHLQSQYNQFSAGKGSIRVSFEISSPGSPGTPVDTCQVPRATVVAGICLLAPGPLVNTTSPLFSYQLWVLVFAGAIFARGCFEAEAKWWQRWRVVYTAGTSLP